MTNFTKLNKINQDKYFVEVNAEQVDGRVGEQKLRLINPETNDSFVFIDGDIVFRLKETRFITDILIHQNDEQTVEIGVETKLRNESEYTPRGEMYDESSAVKTHFIACALCDEVKIKVSDNTNISQIQIFYLTMEDLAEVYKDITHIDSVIDELNGAESRHLSLISENQNLESSIQNSRKEAEKLSLTITKLEVERDNLTKSLNNLESQVQTKEELARKRSNELKDLASALNQKNIEIRKLNSEIGNYPDSLTGYRHQSRDTKHSYFALAMIPITIIALLSFVLINQAIDFSVKSFDTVEVATSFLIAKLPITAALITAIIILIGFAKYCVDIIREVSNQSLELTKFSVLARHIIDDTASKANQELSLSATNLEKSKIIGQLLADTRAAELEHKLKSDKSNSTEPNQLNLTIDRKLF